MTRSFIYYLFIYYKPYSATAGSVINNTKKRDKKEITRLGGGGKEKIRKQKEEQKKETGSGIPTQLKGPFGHLLQPVGIIR